MEPQRFSRQNATRSGGAVAGLAISVATKGDARLLTAMRANVARDMRARFGEGGWAAIPTKSEVARQIRASRVLVARIGDEIVGTVRLTTAQPWAFDASAFTPVSTAIYVLGLAVAPHARELGIGRRLMDAAKAALPAWPGDALWLDTYDHAAGVAEFYRKCGFREVGRVTFNGTPLVHLEWRI